MSTTIAVQKIPDATQRTEPVFAAVDGLLNDIRSRAYELFAQRGLRERSALDDWLEAEREIAWPAAELVEDDAGYRLEVALPGYRPQEVERHGNAAGDHRQRRLGTARRGQADAPGSGRGALERVSQRPRVPPHRAAGRDRHQ